MGSTGIKQHHLGPACLCTPTIGRLLLLPMIAWLSWANHQSAGSWLEMFFSCVNQPIINAKKTWGSVQDLLVKSMCCQLTSQNLTHNALCWDIHLPLWGWKWIQSIATGVNNFTYGSFLIIMIPTVASYLWFVTRVNHSRSIVVQ